MTNFRRKEKEGDGRKKPAEIKRSAGEEADGDKDVGGGSSGMEWENTGGKIMIYGAGSIALGVGCAVRRLFPEKELLGFLVSAGQDHPASLGGLPVMEAGEYLEKIFLPKWDKSEVTVLVGTPETVHDEIIQVLVQHGFANYICVGWELEEKLMEQYFTGIGIFPSLHQMCYSHGKGESAQEKEPAQGRFRVYAVSSCRDRELRNRRDGGWADKKWLHGLQAGADRSSVRIAEYADNTGENISAKNGNYCELTALYWIWRNVLEAEGDSKRKSDEEMEEGSKRKSDGEAEGDSKRGADEYYGMFQYRRLLHMEEEDIARMMENQVDAVLPFPTVHEPDIREHHARYIKEGDWEAMLLALEELQPEYAEAFKGLSRQPYLYNYNILIAKKAVLRDYCAWLFPILERTEELSTPKGWEREDRYIGYLGESLLTLYFMYHGDMYCGGAGDEEVCHGDMCHRDMRRGDRLRIVHTGRIMLV